MLESVHRISAVLFYVLALIALCGAVLLHRDGTAASWIPVVNSLDLPLILCAMVYGGTSLYGGLTRRGMHSMTLFIVITLPLALLFAFFVYLNFAYPVTLPSVS